MFDNAVQYVHHILSGVVHNGHVVVDATMGNGWDTAFLASRVGPSGTVYAFDVQQVALDVTKSRLNNTHASVHLILDGHQTMLAHIPEHHRGTIKACTFNLGYMPGGNKNITTLADTTKAALEQAMAVLAPDGVITVVCYRHAEGERELAQVRTVLADLPQDRYTVAETQFINQTGQPPVVFVVAARLPEINRR